MSYTHLNTSKYFMATTLCDCQHETDICEFTHL